MNKKTKKIIIIGIILLILIFLFFILNYIFRNGDSMLHKEAKIEITSTWGGTDEFGNTLESGSSVETFLISKKDILYETYSNRWTNDKNDESIIDKIITIKSIDDNSVKIETNQGEKEVKYGEQIYLNSLIFVSDGINCVYYVKPFKN